jgi:hypothetical protein
MKTFLRVGSQVYHPVPVYSSGDIQKNYRYGLGYEHLNGRLLRAGHLGVLWGFAEVVNRSIAGAILNLQRPTYRTVYWYRLTGIVSGFSDVLFHSARLNKG